MANIFRTASLWLKVAIICMALGLLLFVIGFATVSWKTSDTRRFGTVDVGLWERKDCLGGRCVTHEFGSNSTDYHKAIQAMECLGLIGFGLAIITMLLYLCMDSFRRRDFLQAATALTFFGILCSCIGYAIFGADNRENHGVGRNIGWSMGIAIAGTVAYGIAGICLLLQLCGRTIS